MTIITSALCIGSSLSVLPTVTLRTKSSPFLLGKQVTSALMTKLLSQVSEELGIPGKFTGHSVRTAMPSLLSSHPDLFSQTEVREMGRWDGEMVDV